MQGFSRRTTMYNLAALLLLLLLLLLLAVFSRILKEIFYSA